MRFTQHRGTSQVTRPQVRRSVCDPGLHSAGTFLQLQTHPAKWTALLSARSVEGPGWQLLRRRLGLGLDTRNPRTFRRSSLGGGRGHRRCWHGLKSLGCSCHSCGCVAWAGTLEAPDLTDECPRAHMPTLTRFAQRSQPLSSDLPML